MISTKYATEITTQKTGNFAPEFTEKCFADFEQSSCAIYLTWYTLLLFFQEFTSIIPFMV